MGFITDGTGTGVMACVSADNRLKTDAITTSKEVSALENQWAFNIETPLITLTSAGKSGVLYLKNNEQSKNIHISGFFNLLGNSTGGSGDLYLYYEFNTVGGTFVAATSNTVTPVNKYVGSTKSMSATVLFGAEGLTVDTGLKAITSLSTSIGRNPLFVEILLPPAGSIAVSVKPQASNTSMDLIAAIDCHLKDI